MSHGLRVTRWPGDGVMTFIAAPAWLAPHITVCIDATRLDGRLFALRVPPYASQMRLRHLISLPDRAPFCLYVGTSDTPLAFEANVHLAEGEVITVHPDIASVDPLPQLAEQLLRLDDWPDPVALPNWSKVPARPSSRLTCRSLHTIATTSLPCLVCQFKSCSCILPGRGLEMLSWTVTPAVPSSPSARRVLPVKP